MEAHSKSTEVVEQSKEVEEVQQQKVMVSSSAAHGQRCRCGCVPNIMGTFEMAALRAKRRAQAKKKAEREEAKGGKAEREHEPKEQAI